MQRLEPECRYAYLSPSELLARLGAKPVLYLPIGSLEWHNEHLPLGTGTLHALELIPHLVRLDREIGPDLYSKQRPFARGPATREGGRELWQAYLADARALIDEALAAVREA